MYIKYFPSLISLVDKSILIVRNRDIWGVKVRFVFEERRHVTAMFISSLVMHNAGHMAQSYNEVPSTDWWSFLTSAGPRKRRKLSGWRNEDCREVQKQHC